MPAYDPTEPFVGMSSEPFLNTSNHSKPTDHLTPSHIFPQKEAHLTPSHAFPPTEDSEIVDPEHARASLAMSDTNESEEHHHHAKNAYESCASCRAKGKKPFQGHADREVGCICVIHKGAVSTWIPEGDAAKGGGSAWYVFLSLSDLIVAVLERFRAY